MSSLFQSLKQFSDNHNLEYTISSFGASLIVNLLHPLDVIKTRLQSHDGRNTNNIVPHYKNIKNSIKIIYQQEGFKGFYKGFAWSLFAASTSRMILFTTYEKLKDQFQEFQPVNQKDIQFHLQQLFNRIKHNSSIMVSEKKNAFKYLKRNKDSVKDIYHENGIKGFWRGFFVSLPLCFHAVIQMSTYEQLKIILQTINKNDTYDLNFMIAGFFAKVSAISLTYPLVTIRTRVQQKQYIQGINNGPKYNGNWDIITKIIKNEGIRGFYKGINASIIMNTPSIAIYFYFYEKIKQAIHKAKQLY